LSRKFSTHPTFLPSGEIATWPNELAADNASIAFSTDSDDFSFCTSRSRFSTACFDVSFSCAAAGIQPARAANSNSVSARRFIS
jgi:hypothetical protein